MERNKQTQKAYRNVAGSTKLLKERSPKNLTLGLPAGYTFVSSFLYL